MKEPLILFDKIKVTKKCLLFWCIAPLLIGIPIPSLAIFYLEIFVAHNDLNTSVVNTLHSQFNEYFFGTVMITMLGLIPFVTLSVICFIAAHRLSSARLACLGIGGLLGILALMIPSHIGVSYPLYSGGHMSSTASIAFVFIPFFCFIPLGIGLLIGWLVSLLPCLRKKCDGE
jgi:hypothetical protein